VTAQSNEKKCDSVDAALKDWRQGDCIVGEQWFIHRLAPDAPLTATAADAAEQGVDLAEVEVRGFLVVSQTCDIVRSCVERAYVEVVPLVEVDAGELRTIERSRRPQYAFVPGLKDSNLVGDLDRVMTVEKAVVASWERIAGCGTDQETRNFAQALARKRVRFAFPDDFTSFASKLQSRMHEKHDKQSDEGDALRALREIRVRAAPSWAANPVDLTFWFIRKEDDPDFKGQSWDKFLLNWLKMVPATGRFSPVNGAVMTLDDLTARDYVESDPLDLDHLSSRQA
jgi:hypothetical protein